MSHGAHFSPRSLHSTQFSLSLHTFVTYHSLVCSRCAAGTKPKSSPSNTSLNTIFSIAAYICDSPLAHLLVLHLLCFAFLRAAEFFSDTAPTRWRLAGHGTGTHRSSGTRQAQQWPVEKSNSRGRRAVSSHLGLESALMASRRPIPRLCLRVVSSHLEASR
jgi:hypothetical protein